MPHLTTKKDGRIRHLRFLAQNRLFGPVKKVAASPIPGLWGEMSKKEFVSCFDSIAHCTRDHPALLDFIQLAVVTEFLRFPEKMPPWAENWINETMDTAELLTPGDSFVFPDLFFTNQNWKSLALPLVDEKTQAPSLCLFTGKFITEPVIDEPQNRQETPFMLPEWAWAALGNETIGAMSAAARAVLRFNPSTRGTFFLYPLIPPEKRVQISGQSLGLPLALLFWSMVRNIFLHPGITATGRIDKKGNVYESGGIDVKFNLAREKGYRLFLSSSGVTSCDKGSSTESISVSTLPEAWFFASLSSPGTTHGMSIVKEMMKSGQLFASNIGNTDFNLFAAAVKSKLMASSLNELQNETEAFEQFSKIISDPCFLNRAIHERTFLVSLFNIDDILQKKRISPDALLRFITFTLHTANNLGDVGKGKKIVKTGDQLIDESGEITFETIADYVNNRSVFHHNQYRFHPDSSAGRQAELLERQNKTAFELGAKIDPVFGRFCGTLSQNFGFCGPGYIQEFQRWNEKARRCFGEFIGKNGNYREEWLRQYSYAVYAFLDAKQFPQAQNALLAYLETDSLDDMERKSRSFSPWQHAALARYFADVNAGRTAVDYLMKQYFRKTPDFPDCHPWQLWCCNGARTALVAGQNRLAETLLEQSVHICLSNNMGATVRVKALLPLYEMWKHKKNLFTRFNRALEKKILQTAVGLNPDHFALVKSADSMADLFTDKTFSIARLFPFSYR